MRVLLIFLFVFSLSIAEAHSVSGTVDVVLKGDKKKQDMSAVIVYLEQLEGSSKTSGAGSKNYQMATKSKQFVPRIMAVPAGASVNFPNYDPIYHNLFSVSAPNQFDLGLYKGGQSKQKSFESPGIIRVFCNVHPQMTATIVVCNTPYFTQADKDGNFSLGTVSSGTFYLKAYSEEGQASQKILVGEQPLTLHLTIDGSNYKKLPHKNKFGKDYSTDENEKY